MKYYLSFTHSHSLINYYRWYLGLLLDLTPYLFLLCCFKVVHYWNYLDFLLLKHPITVALFSSMEILLLQSQQHYHQIFILIFHQLKIVTEAVGRDWCFIFFKLMLILLHLPCLYFIAWNYSYVSLKKESYEIDHLLRF